MRKSNLLIIIFLFAFPFLSLGQDKLLTEKSFTEILIANHPIAKRINLIKDKNQQSLKFANGSFDPKLTSDNSQKVFSKKEYYLMSQNVLTIPTWYGVDVKAGFDMVKGVYAPSEISTPAAGLAQLGLKIPIGQGMFYDKRRNEVEKAEQINSASQLELNRDYNDLLKDALSGYWNWFASYQKLIIYNRALEISKFRFEGVKSAYLGGDAAAIDTLEALLQLQTIQAELQLAKQEFENSRLLLSTFLWSANSIPLEISENAIPDTSIIALSLELNFSSNVDSLVALNPDYLLYLVKKKNAELDKDLYLELLKPKLNLNLNVLNTGFYSTLPNELNSVYFQNNYKMGIDFEMPLYLRKETANLELADIKITEIDLSISNKRLELKNKILNYINKYNTLASNNSIYSQLVTNYSTLLRAEETRFQIGESSLFVVNSRQQKLIESEIKQIENYTKSKLAYIDLLNTIGNLYQEYR